MENNNKNSKIIAIVALLVAVVSLSIAYAALSTTLSITGTATVNSATWDIHFNAGSFQTSGAATHTNPSVTGTSITNLNATLTKPGDSVTYTFTVQNAGTLDASLNTFTKGAPVCSGGNDAERTCQDLEYSIQYNDGPIATGNALNHSQTKTVVMKIKYKDTATTVPSHAVTVEGMDVTFNYVQK